MSTQTITLLERLLEIYDQKQIAEKLKSRTSSDWCRETINRVLKGKSDRAFTVEEVHFLEGLFPPKPEHYDNPKFDFIDLFAGIGGIRKGFEEIGGRCVFTSEWNKFAMRTYKANHYSGPHHKFNSDIREITLSDREDISEADADKHIKVNIPSHDVLLAGFPCQPFSLAGVSKKNSLGRSHGFECEAQGTLFFDVCRIIRAHNPKAFVLENVKNLKSHDKGKTFRVILDALDELGYDVCDINAQGKDPKVIDGADFLPQHRERIVLVGFRKELGFADQVSLSEIEKPATTPALADLLDTLSDEQEKKYTLTPRLWEYLYEYAKKHQAKGNGFGFGLVDPKNQNAICRTLSARYHKDGSEILIDRGWNMNLAESDFWNEENQKNRPRRLTPHECARIMGFENPGEQKFIIPVSDTQAYRQFGNSVVVPVFKAVADLMLPYILRAVELENEQQVA
ncbi:cytosine-specific methyltransferase [Alteromonas halophila]|uniref:Cytosine-specific methyltransferase n=2 Tax=Alteromonas halophila TaxID=516698 RepID=A0A918MYH2_9ALTE|nr:cytosine-specific methyltransferase [Alteromonas halophila]